MKVSYNQSVYYMRKAFTEAKKSKCPRTKVGCILVKDDVVLLSAHNNEVLSLDKCTKDGCIREIGGVLSGSDMELCRGIHAEQKIIVSCSLNNINPLGGTIYSTHSPCLTCAKILMEAGISKLYYCIDYPQEEFKSLFDEVGLKHEKIELEEINYDK